MSKRFDNNFGLPSADLGSNIDYKTSTGGTSTATSLAYIDCTGGSITLNCTGDYPVILIVTPQYGAGNTQLNNNAGGATGTFVRIVRVLNGVTQVIGATLGWSASGGNTQFPVSLVMVDDRPVKGACLYKMQLQSDATTNGILNSARLIGFELKDVKMS